MDRRDTELNYGMPSYAEVEARVRQAHELRSEVFARGVKWLVRQASAGLHWLFGLEWADAARNRKDELALRYARASSPAHIAPAAPAAPAATGRARLAVAGRRTSRPDRDEQPRAA